MRLVWKGIPLICVVFLATLSLWLLGTPLRAMFTHLPMNYNEGWNAFHAARLMTTGDLYPAVSDGVFINYPPLSFYIVGLLGRLGGDYIYAGRAVSLLSFAIVALNVALMARTLGVSRPLSAIASLIFLLFVQIYMADYVASNDPQWLGHAFQTTGLVILLRNATKLRPVHLVAIAVLLMAGGLVKQSLFILPLSVTLWIIFYNRHNLLAWLVICTSGLTLAGALIMALYGTHFIEQVIANQRTYSTVMLAYAWKYLSHRFLPFLAFSALAALVLRADPRIRLLSISLLIASLCGLVLISAVGVIYNALFDVVILMSVLSAAAAQWCARRIDTAIGFKPGFAIAGFALSLPMIASVTYADTEYHQLQQDLERQPAWNGVISTVAATKGPIACETLSLCYWAGRPSAIDYFNLGEYAGLHPDVRAGFIQRLQLGEFALLQQERLEGTSRFDADLNDTVLSLYAPIRTEPTILLAPSNRPSSSIAAP